MNIEIISGSPRNGSISYRIALYLQKLLTDTTEHNIGLIDVRDWEIGMLQNIFTSVDTTPNNLKQLSEKMFSADAFILISPEFNGSYTPALKNLLDHYPKQTHKTFGIVTSSTGGFGGMRAVQQMQLLVNALFGIASPYLLITPYTDKKFLETGKLIDDSFKPAIDIFIKEFLWLAEKMHPEEEPVL